MANYILCYHTGSGVIQRVVNADVVSFEKCGLSDKETKILVSGSSENVGYYLGRRYSGSADELANGNGTMVLQDSFEWSINGLVLSSSMDVSIPSDSAFNLELKILDPRKLIAREPAEVPKSAYLFNRFENLFNSSIMNKLIKIKKY